MKKMTSVILAIVILFVVFPQQTKAAVKPQDSASYVYFDDGSYLRITITTTETRSMTNITGSKRIERVNSSGQVLWYAILRGSFTYDGTIAVCNSSSCDITINSSNYEVISKSVGKRSNYAYVNLTMGIRVLGVLAGEDDYSLTLTCSKDGKLS